jgi:hypothetical protein
LALAGQMAQQQETELRQHLMLVRILPLAVVAQ